MNLFRLIKIEEINVDLPPEYMTIFLIILSILIIIFVLIIVFLVLLYNMMKTQAKMRYPIKNKRILRKERRVILTQNEPSPSNDKFDNEISEKTDKEKTQKEQIEKDSDNSMKLAAVVPVRITSHHSSEKKDESDEFDVTPKVDDTDINNKEKRQKNESNKQNDEKQTDNKDKEKLDKKPALAKPVK
jgi:hypothetical protein